MKMEESKRRETEELLWEEVEREHVLQDEWIDFRRLSYRLPDGTVSGPYYTYSRRDYVVIVASDTDGNYLCVRQYRQGVNAITTEFPAGGIERSGNLDYRSDGASAESSEDSLESAKRELLEETGYESDEWTHLLTIPSNATIADNYAYIYRAKNCRKVSGQHLDDIEFLNVRSHSGQEIDRLIHGGDFLQAVHVMAWLLARDADTQRR